MFMIFLTIYLDEGLINLHLEVYSFFIINSTHQEEKVVSVEYQRTKSGSSRESIFFYL